MNLFPNSLSRQGLFYYLTFISHSLSPSLWIPSRLSKQAVTDWSPDNQQWTWRHSDYTTYYYYGPEVLVTASKLRDSFGIFTNLPKPRTNYMKRSFSYSGALIWDNLPQNIRATESLGFFKRNIDQVYYNWFGLPHGNLVKQYYSYDYYHFYTYIYYIFYFILSHVFYIISVFMY